MDKYQLYKQSGVEWIGDIPENWEVRRIKFLFKSIVEKSVDGSEELLSVSEKKGIIPRKELRDENKELSRSESLEGYLKVNKGDLVNNIMLMWKRGLGFSNYNGIVSPSYSVFRLNEPNISSYWNYLLRTDLYVTEYRRNSTGVIDSRLRLYDDSFGDIFSLLPPISEQLQIVQFLDEKTDLIDKLISTKERKINLLKEQRSSLINQVVTKGLNPNVKMKDSGIEWIGEIPESWNIVSIKHLVSTKITDGPHETPEWVEVGIPFLSVESIQDNKLDFNKKRGFITEELHRLYSKKCKPQRDDIFIVKSGSTTGKSTIVETDEEFNIWSPLCIIRSNKKKILPRFFFNSIQSFYFRRFIELGWSFGTQPNIGMGVIENLKVVLPPLNEQQPIIDFLNLKIIDIDDLVNLELKKIDLLKEYRQSLISEVVTGKIKITN